MSFFDCGVHIKVNNLELCRSFYRDVLNFGEPEFDSPDMTVFAGPGGFNLILQRCTAPFLEHASSASSWLWCANDFTELQIRLQGAGVRLTPDAFKIGNISFYRGTDPEGNVFFVSDSDAGKHLRERQQLRLF